MPPPLLPAVLLLLSASVAAASSFHPDIKAGFMEVAEVPLKSIRQRKTPGACSPLAVNVAKQCKGEGKKPMLNIRRTDPSIQATKPILHFITTPGCSACDRLKDGINRGTEARQLLGSFDVVVLHGPRADWTDRWYELSHEAYVPQVYFYSRDGRPLDVLNTVFDPFSSHDPQTNSHSFVAERDLVAAMREALVRDRRLAAGEALETVTAAALPPPLPPRGAVSRPGQYRTCDDCVANGFGWSIKKRKCGGFANTRCPEL